MWDESVQHNESLDAHASYICGKLAIDGEGRERGLNKSMETPDDSNLHQSGTLDVPSHQNEQQLPNDHSGLNGKHGQIRRISVFPMPSAVSQIRLQVPAA